MLIEKCYRKNKNGEILTKEIVEIECDKCGKKWETFYKNRIGGRKKFDTDLCRSCRMKLSVEIREIKPWQTKNIKKIEIICSNCGNKKLKIPSLINEKNNFCSILCKNKYWRKIKYGHLEGVFEKNPNEIAYLFGLIMGDGHIRKVSMNTVRVSIAFDFSEKWSFLTKEAKEVLNKLQINWYESKIYNNCKTIGFALPNELLKKYNLYYYGDKFEKQPFPSEEIYRNINYAAGLLNSDGYCHDQYYGQYYRFNNTVKSIVDSFLACLSFNDIKYTLSESNGTLDKRTNHIGKKQYIVYLVGGQNTTEKLRQSCSFKLKD